MKLGQKFRVGTNLARLRKNGIPDRMAGTVRTCKCWNNNETIVDNEGWWHRQGDWSPILEEQLEFEFMNGEVAPKVSRRSVALKC